MKILNRVGREDIKRCDKCGTEVLIEDGDLQWSHCEEHYYYVKCPVCGETIWIKEDDFFDAMWKRQTSK